MSKEKAKVISNKLKVMLGSLRWPRYIVLFSIAFSFVLLTSNFAFATSEESGTITVSVLVEGNFNLMVDTNSFDFARMTPGQTGEMARTGGIQVQSSSTNGDPWYIQVSAKPLSSGSDQISNDYFTWASTTEGKGVYYGAVEKSFSSGQSVAYVSSDDESGSAAKVVNRFKFKLHVPEDAKPGNYTTIVMFTMTE